MSYVCVKNAVCSICMNIPTRLAEWLARGPLWEVCSVVHRTRERKKWTIGAGMKVAAYYYYYYCMCRAKCPVRNAVHPDKCLLKNTGQSKCPSKNTVHPNKCLLKNTGQSKGPARNTVHSNKCPVENTVQLHTDIFIYIQKTWSEGTIFISYTSRQIINIFNSAPVPGQCTV